MSRFAAGLGAGLGAIGGAGLGYYGNKYAYVTRNTSLAEIVFCAATGAFIGAAVAAGPDPKQISVTGVGELRSEWHLL